jgi:hypothetical protein
MVLGKLEELVAAMVHRGGAGTAAWSGDASGTAREHADPSRPAAELLEAESFSLGKERQGWVGRWWPPRTPRW